MERFAFVFMAAGLFLCAPAQGGLDALPEVAFSQLSQRDPNPLGEKALAIHPDQWKHGETEHFIYHFVHSYVATPISVEAEFYYRVIIKEMERQPPVTETKSNIYIFERPEDWRQFQALGELEPWTGGIHSQGSLFVVRDPSYKFTDNSLGHEITHLVMHRFYPEGIPCWLNEGFAQYVSKAAHASYERARGYRARPHSEAIAPEKLFSLSQLLNLTHPPNEDVAAFYDESERLVRFLAGVNKATFLTLLDAVGRHQPSEEAIVQAYHSRFFDLAALEKKFQAYASQEFASGDLATSSE
jgi:hypothetical protein